MADSTETAEKTQEAQQDGAAQGDGKTQAQSAEFPEAAATEGGSAAGSIDILLDMNVPVTVAVGQTELPVRRLLQFGPGSVLKLDKSIDEPADLYLKDTKFATGNVVVVDGQFAIKIQQVLGTGDSVAKAAEA